MPLPNITPSSPDALPQAAAVMKAIEEATSKNIKSDAAREENRELKQQVAQLGATLEKVMGIVTNLSAQLQVLQEQNADLKAELEQQKQINAAQLTREQRLEHEKHQEVWGMTMQQRYDQLQQEEVALRRKDSMYAFAKLGATVLVPIAVTAMCPPAALAAPLVIAAGASYQRFGSEAALQAAIAKKKEAAEVKATMDRLSNT